VASLPHSEYAAGSAILSYLNPLRYFIEIVRGIFLKGVGVGVLWPQMACLAVYGVTVLTLSALRFHRRWISGGCRWVHLRRGVLTPSHRAFLRSEPGRW